MKSHVKSNVISNVRSKVKTKEHKTRLTTFRTHNRQDKCLHREPCAHTTTQKGSFWFCKQNHNFIFSEDESYSYEKATAAWKSTKQSSLQTAR